MEIDKRTGWLVSANRIRSPNHDGRPKGTVVDTLIIHCISLPPNRFGGGHVARLFTNCLDPKAHSSFANIGDLRVSAHFFIDRQGELTQFVSVDERAWHAGVSRFQGREAVNDFSVGVELEGSDTQPFEEAQYSTLIDLTRDLQTAFPAITPDRITGHSDIAPDRKTDPGPFFDWHRYLADLMR